MNSDELRRKAMEMHRELAGPNLPRRPGHRTIAEIPAGDGLVATVDWAPTNRGTRSATYLQILRVGPDGSRSAASGTITIYDGVLPGLVVGLADALDLTADHAREAGRRWRGGQRRRNDDREPNPTDDQGGDHQPPRDLRKESANPGPDGPNNSNGSTTEPHAA